MRYLLALCVLACAGTDTDPASNATIDLCINEVMASNRASLEEGGTFPDWVELHNPTNAAIDLNGWWVSDKVDEPEREMLTDLTIDAGGYLLLFPDGDVEEGVSHLSFKLSAAGEAFIITTPEGGMDEVAWTSFTTDVSLARETDCCEGDCWTEVPNGTPGAPN